MYWRFPPKCSLLSVNIRVDRTYTLVLHPKERVNYFFTELSESTQSILQSVLHGLLSEKVMIYPWETCLKLKEHSFLGIDRTNFQFLRLFIFLIRLNQLGIFCLERISNSTDFLFSEQNTSMFYTDEQFISAKKWPIGL